VVAGAVYYFWQRSQQQVEATPAPSPERARALLLRGAALVRLPTSPDRVPEVLPDGSGLRCPVTGKIFPYDRGVLDLIEVDPSLTGAQKTLDTPFTSWLYDEVRSLAMSLFALPSFAAEVGQIQDRLNLGLGDMVLDLACGHGIFTAEWAKRVGPDGLVIGLDLSRSMLARAAHRVHLYRLDNVLLCRGDALQLPLRDGGLAKVNCSGGFHQFPDLPRALSEIARVSAPDAVLTASTFAREKQQEAGPWGMIKDGLQASLSVNFVVLGSLGEALGRLGYGDYRYTIPGSWFGYLSARKRMVNLA
jgi:SAM-dependent methyltransferase